MDTLIDYCNILILGKAVTQNPTACIQCIPWGEIWSRHHGISRETWAFNHSIEHHWTMSRYMMKKKVTPAIRFLAHDWEDWNPQSEKGSYVYSVSRIGNCQSRCFIPPGDVPTDFCKTPLVAQSISVNPSFFLASRSMCHHVTLNLLIASSRISCSIPPKPHFGDAQHPFFRSAGRISDMTSRRLHGPRGWQWRRLDFFEHLDAKNHLLLLYKNTIGEIARHKLEISFELWFWSVGSQQVTSEEWHWFRKASQLGVTVDPEVTPASGFPTNWALIINGTSNRKQQSIERSPGNDSPSCNGQFETLEPDILMKFSCQQEWLTNNSNNSNNRNCHNTNHNSNDGFS